MCRIVLMNKQGERELDKKYGLDKYLKFLEEQLGGHGNGFAMLKNKNIIKLEKGVNLDVRDIADIIRKTDYDWCLFHTRLATIGTRSDENCHPFKRGKFLLAMNGTENSVSFISRVKDITDTEAILDLADKYKLGLVALRNFSSIFMGFYNGKPFVVAGNTMRIRVLNNPKNNAIVFASSFPTVFNQNIFDASECFTWCGGKLPNTLVKHKKRYFPVSFYDSVIYKNDLYGQCYFEALSKENEYGGIIDDTVI